MTGRGPGRRAQPAGADFADETVRDCPAHRVSAQKIPRDHHLLDLARALVDAEDAHVAVEALDAVVGDIAGAAEDLHRPVGDAADHLGGEVFGAAASSVTFSPASRLRAVSSTMQRGGHRPRSCSRRSCPGSAGSRRSSGRTACARGHSATQSSISRSATPTQTPEMCSRPRSSTCMATLKPSPSAPSRSAAGTRAFSKITSQIWAPCWPIFFSGLPMEIPAGRAER